MLSIVNMTSVCRGVPANVDEILVPKESITLPLAANQWFILALFGRNGPEKNSNNFGAAENLVLGGPVCVPTNPTKNNVSEHHQKFGFVYLSLRGSNLLISDIQRAQLLIRQKDALRNPYVHINYSFLLDVTFFDLH